MLCCIQSQGAPANTKLVDITRTENWCGSPPFTTFLRFSLDLGKPGTHSIPAAWQAAHIKKGNQRSGCPNYTVVCRSLLRTCLLLAAVALGAAAFFFALLALRDEVHLVAVDLGDALGDDTFVKAAKQLINSFAFTSFYFHSCCTHTNRLAVVYAGLLRHLLCTRNRHQYLVKSNAINFSWVA